MYYLKNKEMLKSIIFIVLILLLAIFSTYYIYNKFDTSKIVDYSSESLDITFKEENGMNITLNKVTPVTDSVGLSSTPHTLIIKNNLTEKVNYKILLIEDLEKIVKDECAEYQIPHENVRVGIKDSRGNKKIINLNEIENNVLTNTTIDALEEIKYTIRLWVSSESELPMGRELHYHGTIKVEEGE